MSHRTAGRNLLAILMCLALGCLLGCDPTTGGTPNAGADGAAEHSEGPTIVSLTPAITQMLIDMGKRDQIVGVSKEDDASLGLPVCGSYNNPVIAKIVELEPDVVLTESPMGQVAHVPPLLRTLADEGVFELKVIAHSQSIGAVGRALVDAEVGLGAAVGDPEAAERARRLMALRIELVQSVIKDAKQPRVLMLINPTTLGAIGTGVTHDELLRLAGGTNALSHLHTGYLTLDRAQLQQTIRPDVVLVLEPNGVALSNGDARLRAFEGLSIPAVINRRFTVIRHPQVMLPSTALPEVLVEIALALHPDRSEAIREAYDTADLVMKKKASDKDGP